MPATIDKAYRKSDQYELYPFAELGSGKIHSGYSSLAEWIIGEELVMLDGMPGNDWTQVKQNLQTEFKKKNKSVTWILTGDHLLSAEEIQKLIHPFIGEPGTVWGTKTSIRMGDLFIEDSITPIKPLTGKTTVILGPGAALWNSGSLAYLELPKNEIQFRMRSGFPVSFSDTKGLANAEIYKRLYFVDWVIANEHRTGIQREIDIVVDGQWVDTINWAHASDVRAGLENISRTICRVRPWFEPGAWGGQWLKKNIPELNKEEVNYAWSFELIVPENGLVFESDGNLLEIAFDWIMEEFAINILGDDEKVFGKEFPIRFDYLDTIDGGNLSIQCHPSRSYIREQFGETITQDETYYILECEPGANVYLGFQDDIDPKKFRSELERSVAENVPLTITDFVQSHPAQKHDLFLIPNQTIHSAGKNNLVLEISATPYIFTFKMYDWLRLDLEGKPRPINLEHAFKNLNFDRKGKQAVDELIAVPAVIEKGKGYSVEHLPTHKEHFYDIHRLTIEHELNVDTNGKCYVMMVVEGKAVSIQVDGGPVSKMNYAETFFIPAAAKSFHVKNEGNQPVKIIKAFLK